MRIFKAAFLGAVLSVAAVGCGESAGGDPEGPSGEVVLYTSEPQENADRLVAEFNEEYPEVEVQVFRTGTGELLTRIEAEREAGGVEADVMVAADAPTFERLKEQDLFETYTPEGADAIDDEFKDPDGYYTGTRLISTVIGYNTDLVEEPPESWQELTDPEYAGSIGMPSPAYSGAAAYNTALWSSQEGLGWEFVEGVVDNEPTVVQGNGQVQQGLATGQFGVGIIIDYMVRDLEEQGSPVSMVFPEEGVPAIFQPAAIFEGTENREASEAFLDFLVSEEGQQLSVEQNYVPIRGDVEGPEGAPALEEIEVMSGDLEELTEEQEPATQRFDEMMREAGQPLPEEEE